MAKDAANDVVYYLEIDAANRSDLSYIRQWTNLQVAFDENRIWIKGFDYLQINALEVKSIPYKTLYYASAEKLFLLKSRLPDRNIPALLWTPIERALPLQLPAMNHNYFGVQDKIAVQLVVSEQESAAVAILTDLDTLGQYLQTAPAVRLQNLQWILVNEEQALLLGTPLLPIQGEVFWQRGHHLMPAGFDFELPLLADAIGQLVNPAADAWLCWRPDNRYFVIPKNELRPLTLGSFRTSIKAV